MSELQPGMFALIVGCSKHPVNMGKIVTLVRFVFPGDKHGDATYSGDDPCWLVEGRGIIATSIYGVEHELGFSYVIGKYLLPIRPEADPLDVTHKEELHA